MDPKEEIEISDLGKNIDRPVNKIIENPFYFNEIQENQKTLGKIV